MEDPVHHQQVDMLTGIEAWWYQMKMTTRAVEYATLRRSVDTFWKFPSLVSRSCFSCAWRYHGCWQFLAMIVFKFSQVRFIVKLTFPFYSHQFQGTPPGAEHIPFLILFAPLLLIQGAGVLFAAYRLVEKIVLLLSIGAGSGRYFAVTSKARDYFEFLYRGPR